MEQDKHAELVALLDLAMLPAEGETAVDDFAVGLFRYLGYVRGGRVARTRADLPLFICGESRHAKTDVCLVNRFQNDIILLVQEDKRLEDSEPFKARAQLVAEAVAAYNENNINREALGLPPLEEKVRSFAGAFYHFLISFLSDHARHRHDRHVAHVLQNSRHFGPSDAYSTWDLSSK